ncbi:MAG: MmgE/PrpD family protein [Terracoccus sp.]
MSVDGLAAAVATTSWSSAPRVVRDHVVDLVADCVAVAALGSGRPELRRLTELYGRLLDPMGDSTGLPSGSTSRADTRGGASVLGSERGWPATTAMLLNATAVAADQLQDGHRLGRGHPASHVVPAVLAIAEQTAADGPEVLSAVLAGYEAGVRVGMAMGGTPRGVHDIGTWGQLAAAAGTARLLAPGDTAAAGRALELAGSAVLLTDATTVFEGHCGSHSFLGASVQLGAEQGIAAVAGLSAAPGTLDRHLGTVAAASWNRAPLKVNGRWSRFEVMHGYVKTHPTCAHLHGINDAVDDLVASGVRGSAVESVVVSAYGGAACFNAVADSELAARFSAPTSVSIALLDGRLDETTLTAERVASPEVRDLAARVTVVHDPALDEGYPAGRPARVRIQLHDGSRHEATAGLPRGDDDHRWSRDALQRKAARLLTGRFGSAGDDVLTAVHALAAGGDARDLGQQIRSAAGMA